MYSQNSSSSCLRAVNIQRNYGSNKKRNVQFAVQMLLVKIFQKECFLQSILKTWHLVFLLRTAYLPQTFPALNIEICIHFMSYLFRFAYCILNRAKILVITMQNNLLSKNILKPQMYHKNVHMNAISTLAI